MFRLGMFTGDIYESDVDVNTIHECCIMVNFRTGVSFSHDI